MFNARGKILKKDEEKTDLEEEIAKRIYDLEMKSEGTLKANLENVYITGAQHIDFTDRAGRQAQALLVRIPFRSLPYFKKARGPIVTALEKKFKGSTVIVAATRTILSKFQKTHKNEVRPRSRTLTSVHNNLLEDVVAPAHIAAKHTRMLATGGRVIKVFLDPLDRDEVEDKLDAFTEVYRKLTHKKVTFDFAKPTSFQKLLIAHRQNA